MDKQKEILIDTLLKKGIALYEKFNEINDEIIQNEEELKKWFFLLNY